MGTENMQPSRVLIDRHRIASRVRELGGEIISDVREQRRSHEGDADGPSVVLVPILTGSIVFVSDLIREMPLMLRVGVVAVSSYPGATMESKGAKIRSDLPPDLAGKHVLVVDDILDTGRTLALVKRLIAEQQPASLRVCVLLRKLTARREEELVPDYVGFDIPDEFVVGYGLDYDGHYRNLPDIVALTEASASRA